MNKFKKTSSVFGYTKRVFYLFGALLFIFHSLNLPAQTKQIMMQEDNIRHRSFVDDFWKRNKDLANNEETADSINNLRITVELEYFRQYPHSASSLESLELLLKRKYGKNRYKDFELVLRDMSPELNNTTAARSIREFLVIYDKYYQLESIPLGSALDIRGNKIDLISITNEKYLLIDFWASWCKPCRADHPELLDFYIKNQEKVEVLSISIDEDLDLWRAAIKEDEIGVWKHVSTKENNLNTIRRDLLVFSIPVKLLIGKNNRIIGRWDGSVPAHLEEIKQRISNCGL